MSVDVPTEDVVLFLYQPFPTEVLLAFCERLVLGRNAWVVYTYMGQYDADELEVWQRMGLRLTARDHRRFRGMGYWVFASDAPG